MNILLCALVSVATVSTFALLVSGEECYNEAKAKVLTNWLQKKMADLCKAGYKPGTTPKQIDYVKNLAMNQLLKPAFLGCEKKIPGIDSVMKSGMACHNEAEDKNYCKPPVQQKFKDCLIGKVMLQGMSILGWWNECCPKINKKVIEPVKQTQAKMEPWIKKFPKP